MEKPWVQEARLDLLDALKEKERQMSSTQMRLGSMGKGDLMAARDAAQLIKAQGIDKVTPDVIELARPYAPEYIATLERDSLMRSGQYDELVRQGLAKWSVSQITS